MSSQWAYRDDGFTLIELLIAIVVGGMVISVVAAALVLGITTTGLASDEIETNAQAQLAADWFLTDVVSDEVQGAGEGCDAGAPGASLANFAWNLSDDPTTAVNVEWYEDGDAVRRVTCDDDGFPIDGPDTVLLRVEPGTEISCQADRCTLTWEMVADPDGEDPPRVYETTVSRRVQP